MARTMPVISLVSVCLVSCCTAPLLAQTNPLANLPSAPGPTVAAVQAMGNDQWLDLGSPAPDPVWGKARGRAYSPKMAWAADLGAAFFCGTGQHGYVKSDGHYMDDLWVYDAYAHRWVCIYPGAHCATLDLELNEHGFEVTHDGIDNPVSYLSHGYNNLTYDPIYKRFMIIYTECYWWTGAIPQRAVWLGSNVSDPYDRGNLNVSVKHPIFWDVQANRWRRIYVPGIGPDGGRLESVAEYIPTLNQVLFIYNPNRTKVWLYDLASNSWIDPQAQPMPVSVYSGIGCYDSRRDRVLILAGHTFVAYDVATKTWTTLASSPAPVDGYVTRCQINYDSVNDVVVALAFSPPSGTRGAYIYNPGTDQWTTAPTSTMPNLVNTSCSCFYSPELNAHFLHTAGDSSDNGKMFVYRYKTGEPDPIAPAAVTDLAVAAAETERIQLTWTATGDDDNTGRATRYEIRYATGPITAANWADAAVVINPPGPQPAGSTESFWVTGLEPSMTYYFALKVYDEEPNESELSNVVQGSTLADTTPPTIVSVSAAGLSTQVKVVFSEPVDPATAEDVGNYVIDTPMALTVLGAVLGDDDRTVTLTTSPMTNGVTYTLKVSNVTDRAKAPNAIAPDTQVQFSYIALVVLVDFGPAAGTDTYGLEGWNTTIKDTYTVNYAAGPGGTAVKINGSSGSYNFQGVTSPTSRTFTEGERVVVTWYNNHATETYTFTPQISFDDPDRRISGAGGTWYLMTTLTLAPGQTGTTEYVVTATTAGNYSLVNVNASYTFPEAYTLICDKIELLGVTPLLGDVDGDGEVSVLDIVAVVTRFGLTPVDPNWNGVCDFDADGEISVLDIVFVVTRFGNTQ